jgi:hypothetical protein
MFVVELFLPLEKNDGSAVPVQTFDRIKAELTDRFGGVTAFVRAPAEGAWRPSHGRVVKDRVVVFEVMVEQIETAWWRAYRSTLEHELQQEQVLMRAYEVTVL